VLPTKYLNIDDKFISGTCRHCSWKTMSRFISFWAKSKVEYKIPEAWQKDSKVAYCIKIMPSK